MPVDYHHGTRTIEYDDGNRYIRTVDSSTVGYVCTADDADPETFPLNTPVALAGFDPDVIGKAGSTGTLGSVMDAIYDQGYSPLTCIVRVAESADPAEQRANVIGEVTAEGRMTGLKALRMAQSKFGFTPRILGAPGLDKHVEVANELIITADNLKGFAYMGVPAGESSEAVTYRNHFGSKRAMLIWPDFKDSAGAMLSTARALGVRAQIDNEIGWHRVLSNYLVKGVAGITKDVDWHIQNTGTTANYLNSNEVTTLIQRNGYRFWGSRTLAAQTKYVFENFTRTADILDRSIAEAMFEENDKPITRGLIDYIITMVNEKYQQLTRDGYILGGECWIEQEDNMNSEVMNGRLTIRRRFTPVPPLEDLMFKQAITDKFVVKLFEQ